MRPLGSDSPDTNDAERLAAFKRGEPWAFEALYLQHFEALCRYAATLVPEADVGDVVQDVLWRIWNTRDTLAVGSSMEWRYYALRAIRNRAVDLARTERTRDVYGAASPDLDRDDVATTWGDILEDQTDDRLARVQAFIDHLPPRAREVLILRWQHGMSLEQIAAHMRISYGSVRVQHARALDMLRKRLGVR